MGVDTLKLEALAKAATPGPWEVDDCNNIRIAPKGRPIVATIHDYEDYLPRMTDAAYIVAACNALPALITENRILRERVQRLEMRVADYIEERDALVCTKYALEQQREWLAKKCEELSDDVEDSFMPYHIPAKEWIKRAEQATKED